MAKNEQSAKMPVREFIENSISNLSKGKYRSIHVVYSGFNQAFRLYYDEHPRPHVDALVKSGFLTRKLVKGGVLIGLATDFPDETGDDGDNQGEAALEKILNPKAPSKEQ